jgi:hypothetical protein
MRKALFPVTLLFLAACVSPYRKAKEEYLDGMDELGRNPPAARGHFERANDLATDATAEGELDLPQSVTALSIRVRSLIELDRHAEAEAVLQGRIEGFDVRGRYEGDRFGLLLIRAKHLDPERGYAELVLGERLTKTARSRLHLAWQKTKALLAIGNPKARSEAARLCDENKGKLDFDELKTKAQ